MNNKINKKILLLTFEMPPYISGGIGSVAYETVKAFQNMGYEVIVIGPKNKNILIDLNCLYFSIPIRNNYLKTFIMLFKAIKIIFYNKPDFVYSLSGTYCGLVCFIVNKLFKIKYFVVAHGVEFIRFKSNKLLNMIMKKIYNTSSKVFAVSNFTKNKLIDFGINKNNIFVCYNGVNTGTFYKLTESENINFMLSKKIDINKFNLLTISRLDERKGHINVLKALNNIFIKNPELKNNIVYLIGGKGPTYKNLLEYIKINSLSNNVKMLGFISSEEINNFYNICDLFIHPNIFIEDTNNVEGFGLVFLEAAAAGKTSIGGISGGSTEAISNNITGLTVDGNNINEIEKSILDLYYNKNKLFLLSENAYNNSVKNFNWNYIITKILDQIKTKIS